MIVPAPRPTPPRQRRRLGTVEDVHRDVLPLPKSSLYDGLRSGSIPGLVKVGHRVLVDLDKLDAWLADGGGRWNPAPRPAPPSQRRPTRHTAETRGPAARDRQLGRVQRKLLAWLFIETQLRIEHGQTLQHRGSPNGDTDLRAMFHTGVNEVAFAERHGVPWDKVADKLEERRSALSEALAGGRRRSLEERRLVTIRRSSGGRTNTVKLTAEGTALAPLAVFDANASDFDEKIREGLRSVAAELNRPLLSWDRHLLVERTLALAGDRAAHSIAWWLGRAQLVRLPRPGWAE